MATQSVGTMETLQAMAKLVLKGSHPEVVMHIYCRTPRAILLLGISDERGKALPMRSVRNPAGTIFYSRPLEAINVS